MSESADGQRPRVLILALHHGSTHVRIARALEKALLRLRPNLKVEVVDALAHCTPWFRAYYNSYEIPLKYWPGLWNYIESHQFEGETSGPWWLYRRGARPLFRFIEAFAPDVVVATEVGLGEIAVIHKREFGATYSLVGMQTFAYERLWAQPEVDLFYPIPGKLPPRLEAWACRRKRSWNAECWSTRRSNRVPTGRRCACVSAFRMIFRFFWSISVGLGKANPGRLNRNSGKFSNPSRWSSSPGVTNAFGRNFCDLLQGWPTRGSWAG